MSTEASPTLRPLRMVEILDRAVRLYRNNFITFIAIIGAVQIPISIISVLVTLPQLSALSQYQDPAAFGVQGAGLEDVFGSEFFVTMGASCLLSIVALVLIQGVATATLTRAIADDYLGMPVGFVNAYRKIGKSWQRLVGVILLSGLIGLGLFIWFLVPCIGWVTGIGILIFFGQVITPLAIPAVVLEGKKGYAAIRRGWDLARRRFWWVAGFVAILFLFNQIVVGGPTYLITLIFQAAQDTIVERIGLANIYLVQTVAETLASLVTGLLYLPLQLTCMTLLYFDLRVRTEGFDLALQADSALGEEADIDTLIAQAPSAETSGIVTWPEMGYFALISVGAVAIGIVLGMLNAIAMAAVMGATGGF